MDVRLGRDVFDPVFCRVRHNHVDRDFPCFYIYGYVSRRFDGLSFENENKATEAKPRLDSLLAFAAAAAYVGA